MPAGPPALDASCSLMTGRLAPALWSWQGQCDLGRPVTWGLGQASLSARFGSSVAVGCAAAAGRGELSFHGAVALLGDRSLQHRWCQHSPDFGGRLLVALAPCVSLVSSNCGSSRGRWTPVPGIHHWARSPRLKVHAGVHAPGELVSFSLGLGDLRSYGVFALSQRGLGTR